MAIPKVLADLFDGFIGRPVPNPPNLRKPRGSARNKYAPNSGKRQQAAIAKARGISTGKDAA
jgi:hypothetical protein